MYVRMKFLRSYVNFVLDIITYMLLVYTYIHKYIIFCLCLV